MIAFIEAAFSSFHIPTDKQARVVGIYNTKHSFPGNFDKFNVTIQHYEWNILDVFFNSIPGGIFSTFKIFPEIIIYVFVCSETAQEKYKKRL